MKVFVIGGTGFIGYHSSLEFLKRGHEVSTISLPDFTPGDWFPDEIRISYGNIFELSDEALIKLFTGNDALVYAAGPDDRVKTKAPAYDFFYKYLVDECGRIIAAARKAGIGKCVVLNSYFAYFDRIHPEYRLSRHHPYIKCRVEQASRVIEEGKGSMDVMVLELPYIFGTMPWRVPLWKNILVDMLKKRKVIFYPSGGSAMISVEHVAEAVAGAIEYGEHGARYPVGDVNNSWEQMLGKMLESLELEDKKIFHPPCFLTSVFGLLVRIKERITGHESGLNHFRVFRDIMCREFFIDPSESVKSLKYGRGGLDEAIDKTMKACL